MSASDPVRVALSALLGLVLAALFGLAAARLGCVQRSGPHDVEGRVFRRAGACFRLDAAPAPSAACAA